MNVKLNRTISIKCQKFNLASNNHSAWFMTGALVDLNLEILFRFFSSFSVLFLFAPEQIGFRYRKTLDKMTNRKEYIFNNSVLMARHRVSIECDFCYPPLERARNSVTDNQKICDSSR